MEQFAPGILLKLNSTIKCNKTLKQTFIVKQGRFLLFGKDVHPMPPPRRTLNEDKKLSFVRVRVAVPDSFLFTVVKSTCYFILKCK